MLIKSSTTLRNEYDKIVGLSKAQQEPCLLYTSNREFDSPRGHHFCVLRPISCGCFALLAQLVELL